MKPVDEIILSRKEKRLLRKIEKEVISLDDPETKTAEFSVLNGYGMLEQTVSDKFPKKLDPYGNTMVNAYKISDEVSRYWLYQKQQRRTSRKESRRYWITTAIAVVALALSVLSLIWQMYTWSKDRQEKSESQESKSIEVATTEAGCPPSSPKP